jgi:imidazolonepropionase-like amidohydrolase
MNSQCIPVLSDLTDELSSQFALLEVSVVDGYGGPPVADQAVVVRNGRIPAVIPMGEFRSDPSVQEVVLEGHFVMPGLIDAHVHLSGGRATIDDQEIGVIAEPKLLRAIRSVYEAQQLLKRGFTTARDVSWNGLWGITAATVTPSQAVGIST